MDESIDFDDEQTFAPKEAVRQAAKPAMNGAAKRSRFADDED